MIDLYPALTFLSAALAAVQFHRLLWGGGGGGGGGGRNYVVSKVKGHEARLNCHCVRYTFSFLFSGADRISI